MSASPEGIEGQVVLVVRVRYAFISTSVQSLFIISLDLHFLPSFHFLRTTLSAVTISPFSIAPYSTVSDIMVNPDLHQTWPRR